ncbi:DUF3280 domain-containing protein [Azohydromonas caseinilytica]|uniref:DUF3280 domain-containing protein n=1 Tax=Azohydromonas caseinilytica TaxID=2728836 RepID=A0A848F6T6_9BURK|nr:DUF3280 domain-containing protein [Azohydromonas caseinilytica]NML15817.1 DUF3280 domain-containing protein [Azohydromonas caseinilytica]
MRPLHPMRRRRLLAVLAAALAAPAWAQQTPPPSAVVIDFDLLDDHPNPEGQPALQRRLRQARESLEQQLQAQGLYRIVPLQGARALLDKLQAEQEYMHRCEDCARQVGRQLDTDYAITGWVQKVSELILNLNIEVHDVRRGRVVLSKSVDMRGNNDESWERAVRFMVRDMAQKRQTNPKYGM